MQNLSPLSDTSIDSNTFEIDKIFDRNKVTKLLRTPPESRNQSSIGYLVNVFNSIGISSKHHEEKFRNKDFMQSFCRHITIELFRAGAKVFSQGDVANGFFIVWAGSVEVLVKDVVTKTDKVAA